jgi:streptogramin lyase
LLVLCLTFFGIFPNAPIQAESAELTAVNAGIGREYAVPNGPRNLAEEAPGRIWYTSTDAGGIGFLEVTSEPDDPIVRYRTDFYGFGVHSEPYDLVYVDGVVWFTLRGIRALGKIDADTRAIELFTLLSVGAAPTGIDNDANGKLWIAQNNGRISRFDPVTETFEEKILPDNLHNAPRLEDALYQSDRAIWFTMPDANRVLLYNPVTDSFFSTLTGEPSPMQISIDSTDSLWVTASGTSRIGRLSPSTLSIWEWIDPANADGGPVGIVTFKDDEGILQMWITESRTGTIGHLEVINQFTVIDRDTLGPNSPAGSTWGIIRSSDGHLWVADTRLNLLYELREPYINRIYMVLVDNGKASQQ